MWGSLWNEKRGKGVCCFKENLSFFFKTAFYYLSFLPDCEIQEWEITDPQTHKPLLLFSWIEILDKQEVLKKSALFVVCHSEINRLTKSACDVGSG